MSKPVIPPLQFMGMSEIKPREGCAEKRPIYTFEVPPPKECLTNPNEQAKPLGQTSDVTAE